jgi:hypothetical protein
MRTAIIGKFDEVRQWILLKYQRELLAVTRPVCDRRSDVQEDLEANLDSSRFLSVQSTTESARQSSHLYLRDDFSRFPEVATSGQIGLGEEVVNQAQTNVISHLVQLLVDLGIRIIEVSA